MTDFSILMPVFNELATVETAITRTLEADYPVDEIELVLCDDGSTDGTRQLLRDAKLPDNVHVVEHTRNQGKGAALVTALSHAKGRHVGIMDADLEYDPADMAALLRPLLDGEAEAVFGTRGFQSHSAYGFWYVVGNKGVTMAANVLYNSWVSDIMTCHKVMQADLMRSLRLREPGFAVEPEITARLLRSGARIYEVPVTYSARSRDAGKKLTTIDGFRVLRTLLRCRFD
jgi:glycosyltransferase involved in cell wall biosynthesis